MKPYPLARFFSALLLATFANLANAAIECFPNELIGDWTAGDLAGVEDGASRELLSAPGFELCGDDLGFGADTDQYRYLVQRSNGDLQFIAELAKVDDSGMGGIVARINERDDDAAYIAISVYAESGRYRLRSTVRLDNATSNTEPQGAVPVTLPVWLQIERDGDQFSTRYSSDGITFTDHLTLDASSTDLSSPQLLVGMNQASGTAGQYLTALFGSAKFFYPPTPRPDVQACVDGLAIPTQGNTPVELRGFNLNSIRNVELAGIPARILEQDDRRLLVQSGPLPRGKDTTPFSGNLVIESEHGREVLGSPVVYAGVPFVRGDVNGDEIVDSADLTRLRLTLRNNGSLACDEAADVNGDHTIDSRDVSYLYRYLRLRGAQPPAPFPLAGYAPEGGRACGLPLTPTVLQIRKLRASSTSTATDSLDGSPSASALSTLLREGDRVALVGNGFPRDPAGLTLRFGNVRTEILAGSSSTRIIARILEVADGGQKCPVIFRDLAAEPVAVAGGPTRRVGLAYGLVEGTAEQQARICPIFLPSRLEQLNRGSVLADGSTLFLPIDRSTWDPSKPIQVNVSLAMPLINGVSRGSRDLSFTFMESVPPELDGSPGTHDYDTWLANLAKRINHELNGDEADQCGGQCDAKAEAVPNGIQISHCDPVLTWPDNGLCCDPPAPTGPGINLTALPPPLSSADSFQNLQGTCTGDWSSNPRLEAWCEFEKLIRTAEGTGLPIWESYVPLSNALQGPGGINNVEHPNDRTINEKAIMFSTDAFYEMVEHGYNVPCRAAARRYYCNNGHADWMPAFSSPQRVVKTFWLNDNKLPPSIQPDELYNYVDNNGTRRNLVGMHMAISTGSITDYWTWSTFFAPRLVGEQLAVDGTQLKWNDACTVGSGGDRPVEINGVWENYVMCTDSAPGEQACGNPWGPTNECLSLSCDACHKQTGAINMPGGVLPELSVSWLPSLADNEILACYEEIEEANNNGVELYKSWAPEECQ